MCALGLDGTHRFKLSFNYSNYSLIRIAAHFKRNGSYYSVTDDAT